MINCVLCAVLGSAVGYIFGVKEGRATYPSPSATSIAHGEVTPARNELCKAILDKEHRPNTLYQLAGVFGEEGLVNHANALKAKADRIVWQMQGAAELVERSRTGDQQAWAMIQTLGEDAKRGSVPAQVSCKLIEQYCKDHPPPEGAASFIPPDGAAPPPTRVAS